MNSIRPRRSALYVPGSNIRAIEKSATLDADVIILDLEDSVAPDDKAEARARVQRAARGGSFRDRELVIRINAIGTDFYRDDFSAAIEAAPDAILLSKVEAPTAIELAARALSDARAPDRMSLWCMIETPRGVLAAERIASAHERLSCLVMGTSDLTCDLRALHSRSREPLLTSLGLCLLAARAHGRSILDGVCLDITDERAFVDACVQGRQLGFDGKTLIHPRQIAPCNRVFSPTQQQVAEARAVVDAFAAARAAGRGVAVVSGRLVESMHVREAERTLALDAATSNDRVRHDVPV